MAAWPDAGAWLFGWVDSDVAGYRKIDVGGAVVTLTAGYYRWPDYITQWDTDLGAQSWAAATDAAGVVTLSGSSAVITWTDRAGYLLGMAAEPTQATPGAVTSVSSVMPPPGCIPLVSAYPEQVSIEAERELMVDRAGRGWGYKFGSARIWRWRLEMHHLALDALRDGWMSGGKVTLSSYSPADFGSSSAWSTSNLDGHLDGYIIGLETAEPIGGPVRDYWRATLLVATAGP